MLHEKTICMFYIMYTCINIFINILKNYKIFVLNILQYLGYLCDIYIKYLRYFLKYLF